MSRPPKRRTYAAALRAIQRQRGRGFRRVNAPPEPQSMSKIVACYHQLYGRTVDKGAPS